MAKIVMKFGSNLLVKGGQIDKTYIITIASLANDLLNAGHEVAIVTSGAAAAGRVLIPNLESVKDIVSKQALCAVGQPKLMEIYQVAFSFYNRTVGQILVTRDDFTNRQRFLNLRNTLIGLEKVGVIPIVNENDTVSVDEIKLGDNDTLSAMFSVCWNADYLFLMTSVDGVIGSDGRVLDEYHIGSKEPVLANLEKTSHGTGGIATKINAAKIAAESGVESYIINGRRLECVKEVLAGKRCGTHFSVSGKRRLTKKESWVKYISKPKGTVYINDGAFKALIERKSLLPVGITDIEGEFSKGDVVLIMYNSKVIGKGITNYGSEELRQIKGKKSSEISEEIYTYDEAIHADNIILEISEVN
ncbi:MAG: glutamate 5-kinase [Fervidobacterium sp.]|uniref:Glutamate 5-kinase n=1 Tax=Fervidobacterium gondwanense DSM 13020 TaxID=1121883 RepID=A0A1M7RX76_FERGO|nr:glutamate 5-kinase [Fervidobacterium gondwanense]UXF00082.1 hypothetical protein IB67_00335 [Fervidobacterium riparium]SHN50883.1 glutamate 5-kinase [Fervidobacterium gondwanense DSM 13020]